MTHTKTTLKDVIRKAWMDPFTTRCDFARDNAELIAMAAIDGFITTKVATGIYGNKWLVTDKGLRHYEILEGWES